MTDAEIVAHHLARLRAGAYSRTVQLTTPDGIIEIDAADAREINREIERALARMVKRARRAA